MNADHSRARIGTSLSVLLAAAALSACVATPIEPAITGYSCCNLRSQGGWVSSSNLQDGTVIPVGEPMRLSSLKKRHYVYGTVGGNETGFRDDDAKTESDTLQWLRRIVVAEDPREQLAKWPTEVRQAVRSARVTVGMTRAQVLMSLGHPARVDTPDLGAATWRYWTPLDDETPVDVRFGEDGTLAGLEGKPTGVRSLMFDS